MEQSMSEEKSYEKYIIRKAVDDYWRAEEKFSWFWWVYQIKYRSRHYVS